MLLISTASQRENITAIPTIITSSVAVGTKKKLDNTAKKIHSKTKPPNICPFPEDIYFIYLFTFF